ncbi:hypothetical protein I5080_14865 [Salmonella enterica]|nr:hypothetical protein I5080_14865 [Salmonella enterica]
MARISKNRLDEKFQLHQVPPEARDDASHTLGKIVLAEKNTRNLCQSDTQNFGSEGALILVGASMDRIKTTDTPG